MSKKLIANDVFANELYAASNQGSQQRALRLYAKAADEMIHLIQAHQTKRIDKYYLLCQKKWGLYSFFTL